MSIHGSVFIEDHFPPHKAGLYLEHNTHKCLYQTVQQYLDDRGLNNMEWVSPEDRDKSINMDELWTLQWYPDTPVGFCQLASYSIHRLLKAAMGQAID